MWLDNSIVFVYLAGILALGLWSGRGIRSLQDYSVAGRSYPAWVIFATLSASFIGGGFSLGNAEKVFLWGIVNIVALWGFSLKEILVALLIAPRLDRFKGAISTGDIMATAYGKTGKVITGLFSVLLCAGIVGAQVGAMGKVFNVFLGLDTLTGILIGCGIVIVYSTVGGMKAVVFTDVVQFSILVIGIPLALAFGIAKAGGIGVVTEAAGAGRLALPVVHIETKMRPREKGTGQGKVT